MPKAIKLGLSITLFSLSGIGFIITALVTAAAALAYNGIFADVSPAENRAMAAEAYPIIAIAGGSSLALLVLAFVTLRAYRKHPKK